MASTTAEAHPFLDFGKWAVRAAIDGLASKTAGSALYTKFAIGNKKGLDDDGGPAEEPHLPTAQLGLSGGRTTVVVTVCVGKGVAGACVVFNSAPGICHDLQLCTSAPPPPGPWSQCLRCEPAISVFDVGRYGVEVEGTFNQDCRLELPDIKQKLDHPMLYRRCPRAHQVSSVSSMSCFTGEFLGPPNASCQWFSAL